MIFNEDSLKQIVKGILNKASKTCSFLNPFMKKPKTVASIRTKKHQFYCTFIKNLFFRLTERRTLKSPLTAYTHFETALILTSSH